MSVSSRDRVRFEIEAETETDLRLDTEDRPFAIALVGDFGGAAERRPLASRKPLEIDRDNFEAVMQRIGPTVSLPGGPLRITSIDHFHPDHLYTHLPAFDSLRDLRSRLSDPETAKEAIREVLGRDEPVVEPPPSGSLLDAILGGGVPAAAAPAPVRPSDELNDFIRNAVRPYLVDRPDARTPELLRQTDEAAAGLLRRILHARPFQSLESIWRTTFELVRRLETGPDLTLWLIDIPQNEFASDPLAVSQVLREAGPYSVIASFYSFGAKSVQLMTEAGRIGRRCGASWLAEADPSLIDAGDDWPTFRRSPEAGWIGLALPRVLLRMPYGKQTSSCESLDFEEISGKPEARHMLWANPAPLCAMLLGQAFEQHGWQMRPGAVREIGDLPVYVFKDEDGDSIAVPCAETPLTEDTAEALMDYGIMPVAWERNADAVRVLRFQSVAQPPTALQGPWRG
jgi:type VI secretion system protein ImpC